MIDSMALGKKKDVTDKPTVEPHELISSTEVEQVRKSLIESHADLVVRGMLDKDVRAQLEKIVKQNYKQATKGNPDVVAYVVRETIGTGVIEDILQDESITDVGYNGNELIIESNDDKHVFDTNFEITEAYIVRLVNKFANANNKEFTSKSPIFDGRFENVRINAVHSQNTVPESGTTMALRVVRPKLALTKENFEGFAPMFMYDFFEAAALSRANMVISGTTGTGKTELHKLISGFIPFDDRILLIEDTPETFMKQMFHGKDVYSWVTSENIGVTQLIKAGLRNNPTWIMVTETRGQEAYEMIQAVLSGHSIITSLHATDARAIPSRFVNMAKMGYDLSEEALKEDIRLYFNFGVHIKKVKYKGMVLRYLAEVVEFHPEGDISVFKQRFVDGVFYFETTDYSDDFKYRLEETMVKLDFPKHFKSERPLNPKDASSFEATIPLDKSGRPDYEKIKKMDTNINILMGREKSNYIPDDGSAGLDFNTNREGYIVPEVGSGNGNRTSNHVRQLKQKAERSMKTDTSNNAKRTKPQNNRDIEGDLQRILNDVNNTKSDSELEAPKQPQVKPKPKPERPESSNRTADDILKQKRQQLRHEDV